MGKCAILPALTLSATVGSFPVAAEELADAKRGDTLFQVHCSGCHEIGQAAINRVGPPLTAIFGRPAGAINNFKYSKSMTRMGDEGLTWTLQTLDAYLENPKALVGGTRMNYTGMAEPEARDALLAFLREHSDIPQNNPEAEPTARNTLPDLDPAILAIEGDPEYGAYLSSACSTCHQRDGSDQAIPTINQWPPEDFVVAMHAYKEKLRPHPVMQMMSSQLSNEEIAALAAYFTTQD